MRFTLRSWAFPIIFCLISGSQIFPKMQSAFGKFFLKVFSASALKSVATSVEKPLFISRPHEKPPAPENKSRMRNCLYMCDGTFRQFPTAVGYEKEKRGNFVTQSHEPRLLALPSSVRLSNANAHVKAVQYNCTQTQTFTLLSLTDELQNFARILVRQRKTLVNVFLY